MNHNLNSNTPNNKEINSANEHSNFNNKMFNSSFLNQNNSSSKDIFLQHSRQPQREIPNIQSANNPQPNLPSLSKYNILPPSNFPRVINNSQTHLSFNNSHGGFYIPKLTSPQEYIHQKTQEYINKHPESINLINNEQKKKSLDLTKITLQDDIRNKNILEENHIHKKPAYNLDKLIPVECPICHKKFNRLSSYTNHKNLHTGERPYTCKTCGKSFNASPNLSRHKKIHLRTK